MILALVIVGTLTLLALGWLTRDTVRAARRGELRL